MLAMANIETWPVPKHLGSPLMKVILKGSKHRNARKTPDIIAQVKFKSSVIFLIHSTCSMEQKPGTSLYEHSWGEVCYSISTRSSSLDPGVCWYFMHNFAGSLTALLYTGLNSFCSCEVYVHFCQRSEKGWRGMGAPGGHLLLGLDGAHLCHCLCLLSLHLSLSLSSCWSSHVSSSLWSRISRVTSLSQCSMVMFF